jgi:hypothetical protein
MLPMRIDEVVQHGELVVGVGPRLAIDGTQPTDPLPRWNDQRRTSIRPNLRSPGHERIVGEPRIGRGVRNHVQLGAADRVRAERDAARCLAHVETDARLEPLPVDVDERHQRDRHARRT